MGVVRFILALAVIIAHSSPILGLRFGSLVAVPCFFVISGFYMALILSEKYVGSNSSYWLFISNRLLRLYPIYAIILITTLAANIYAYKHGGSPKLSLMLNLLKDHKFPISGFILYIFSSITLLFQDFIPALGIDSGSLYFAKGADRTAHSLLGYFNFVPQSWSLGSELFFYILAPFIVKKNNIILFGVIIICIIFRFYMVYYYNYDIWNQILFPSVLPYFILGIFSYRIYKLNFLKLEKINLNPFALLAMPTFLLLLNTSDFVKSYSALFIYPIVFSLLIPFIFITYKNKKWDKQIGELSYPMYISHILTAMILKQIFPNPIAHTGLFLSTVSVIVSIILIKFVADPIERIRQKRVKMVKQKNSQISKELRESIL